MALSDLSAAERRDLREQLRRAWSDVAERHLSLGKTLALVVERAGVRILYVPFVFDPSRWRVLPLSNPVSAETRNRFKVVRSGSVMGTGIDR